MKISGRRGWKVVGKTDKYCVRGYAGKVEAGRGKIINLMLQVGSISYGAMRIEVVHV